MISKDQRKTLLKVIKGEIFFNEPMKNHTSLCIGGPAEVLVIPRNEYDLKFLLKFHKKNGIPLTVIGNGTKLLVSDKGVDGIVIKMSGCFDKVSISGTNVEVGGGHSLTNLSRLVADHGLSGLEFAVGIPGTVAGGVVTNAGAHGVSIKDVLTNVIVMNYKGEIQKYSKSDIYFEYRKGKFQNNVIILNVRMKLVKDDIEKILERVHEHLRWRRKTQPLDLPNAGCIFKNPMGLFAGKLIDMAGLKGITVGGAKISEKHANFIINIGNATARDVKNLMNIVQKEVFRKSRIILEPEIKFLGRFS